MNSIDTVIDNISDVWSNDNKKSYNELTIDSSYKARWNCQNCGGIFKRTVKDYIYNYKNNRENCPYCAGKKALAGFNSLDTVIENIDDVWEKINKKSYTELLPTSSYVANWKCSTCHGVYKKKSV